MVMLGAGAVRNRTYRGGITVSRDSLVSIKHLANEPLRRIEFDFASRMAEEEIRDFAPA